MLKMAEPAFAADAPRNAKPRRDIDRKALRERINAQFAESFAYLAK